MQGHGGFPQTRPHRSHVVRIHRSPLVDFAAAQGFCSTLLAAVLFGERRRSLQHDADLSPQSGERFSGPIPQSQLANSVLIPYCNACAEGDLVRQHPFRAQRSIGADLPIAIGNRYVLLVANTEDVSMRRGGSLPEAAFCETTLCGWVRTCSARRRRPGSAIISCRMETPNGRYLR
jgi:hypothetical protein